eukprot:scaffold1581_cov169-Amphora_coffeaeformis.AAC.12
MNQDYDVVNVRGKMHRRRDAPLRVREHAIITMWNLKIDREKETVDGTTTPPWSSFIPTTKLTSRITTHPYILLLDWFRQIISIQLTNFD